MSVPAVKKNTLLHLFLLLLTGLVILLTPAIQQGMRQAISICLTSMIPALYAMLICTELLLHSGAAAGCAKRLHPMARRLFHADGGEWMCFLLSQVAGYPIGASLLARNAEHAAADDRCRRSFLAGTCFGGGPAFFMAVFAGAYQEKTLCLRSFCSCVLANFLLFCIISRVTAAPHSKANRLFSTPSPAQQMPFTAAVVTAAFNSAKALLKICGMVLLFGGLLGMMDAMQLTHRLALWLSGLTDLSPDRLVLWLHSFAEISQLTALRPFSAAALPFAAGMLSFGGICIFLQIAALAGNALHLLPVIALRITAALLTGGICFLWNALVPLPALTAPAAVIQQLPPDAVPDAAPLPACFLLVMSLLLLKTVPDRKV